MSYAYNLSQAIDYQDNAIVSKTIKDSPQGTVTLFAFAAGQALSEHTAPFDALVFIVDGQLDITIAGNPLSAVTGDLVTMPANKPHALKAPQNAKMLLIMIRAEKS